MALFQEVKITWQFLDQNPETYFVFGDNLQKSGKEGACVLRDHPRSIGFITKKFPDNLDGSFYRPEEYVPVFFEELEKLRKKVESEPNKVFYISRIGSSLANKFHIWEKLIQPFLTHTFKKHSNVIFCWDN
jgi:hypothetical protein